jgi:hypothetical protein
MTLTIILRRRGWLKSACSRGVATMSLLGLVTPVRYILRTSGDGIGARSQPWTTCGTACLSTLSSLFDLRNANAGILQPRQSYFWQYLKKHKSETQIRNADRIWSSKLRYVHISEVRTGLGRVKMRFSILQYVLVDLKLETHSLWRKQGTHSIIVSLIMFVKRDARSWAWVSLLITKAGIKGDERYYNVSSFYLPNIKNMIQLWQNRGDVSRTILGLVLDFSFPFFRLFL